MSRKTTISIEFEPHIFSQITHLAGQYQMSIKDYLIWTALTKEEPIIEDVEWAFDNWPKGQTYEGKHSRHHRTRPGKVSSLSPEPSLT